MYQIKLILLLLLFSFSVHGATDCESAFHSTSKSGVSNWLGKKDLLDTINNSPEINSSREYQLQYKDKTLNSTAKSNWLSSEQLVELVKDSNEIHDSRTYRIRYRPTEPNLMRRTAQVGAAGAKTAMAVTQTAVNTVTQQYKKLQEDARSAALEEAKQRQAENPEAIESASVENSNTVMTNLKYVGKAMAGTAVGLGAAGAKTVTNKAKQLSSVGVNAVSNARKKASEARAERVAARADARTERAKVKVETKEQEARNKEEAKQQKAQAQEEAKQQQAEQRAQRQQEREQARANRRSQWRFGFSNWLGPSNKDSSRTEQTPTETSAQETSTKEADKTAQQPKTPPAQETKSKDKAKTRKEAEQQQAEQQREKLLNQTISDALNLGARINKALATANIINMKDLLEKSEAQLLEVKDIGKKSVEKIKEQLKEKDLSLQTSTAVETEFA